MINRRNNRLIFGLEYGRSSKADLGKSFDAVVVEVIHADDRDRW
jgi:hypothetical protein